MKTIWMTFLVFWVTLLGLQKPPEAARSMLPEPSIINTIEIPGWQDISGVNAPVGRFWHTAIWTGSEMIIFGGIGGNTYAYLNDGGRYNPTSDAWAPVSMINAPSPRTLHTAVWTGSEMLIWGGVGDTGSTADGARYNPMTNQWTPISTDGAPSPRYYHSAVWTGSEMIVWGGTYLNNDFLNDGARYNPTTDQWLPMATEGAPSPRIGQAAVWTGSEMIVWGCAGTLHLRDGGRYNPTTNSWKPLPTDGAPEVWAQPSAVWTGNRMVAWGGIAGNAASYDPITDDWTSLAVRDPSDRSDYTAVWTGMDMFIWGGWDGYNLHNDGVGYNPAIDSWTLLPLAGTPSARGEHTAVWTGRMMIIWGGRNADNYLGDGARLWAYHVTYLPRVSK